MDVVRKCEMCDITDKLQVCSRCHTVYYCGKAHQKAHWKEHKLICRVSPNSSTSADPEKGKVSMATKTETMYGHQTSTNSSSQSSFSSMSSSSTTSCKTDGSKSDYSFAKLSSGESTGSISSHIGKFTLDSDHISGDSDTDYEIGKSVDQAKVYADLKPKAKRVSAPTFFLPGVEQEGSTSASGYDYGKPIFLPEEKQMNLLGSSSLVEENAWQKDSDSETASNERYTSSLLTEFDVKMDQRITYAAGCLNRYGCCVIDNLCGESFCSRVLEDVQSLHDSGIFQDGQVTGPNSNIHPSATKRARQDIIAWVTGDEECYPTIGLWMKQVDKFIRGLSTHFHYTIKKRSKAMIACYPGSESSGRRYVKHVDNPNGDGRVITCLYYLNRDWDSRVDGGVLRLYPKGQSKVATVDPKFDRLLLFWSDDRNPHEVMPAFSTRYAITLWYMDSDELEAGGRQNTEEGTRFSYVTLQ